MPSQAHGQDVGRVDRVHRAIGSIVRAQTMVPWSGAQFWHQWDIYRERFKELTPAQKAGIVAFLLLQLLVLGYLLHGGGGELMHGAQPTLTPGIARISLWISHSWLGIPLLYLSMAVTGIPPITGFSSTLTLCGMAFARSEPNAPWQQQVRALGQGWAIATVGLLLSACLSFVIVRRVLANLQGQWHMLSRIKSDRRFLALQTAVRERGLMMAILARFCPLPYSYTNLLLASLDSLQLRTYALSVALTSPRLLFPLFMGAKLYDLSDKRVRAELDAQTKQLNVLFIALSMGLAMLASAVIWRETSRMLATEESLLGDTDEFVLEDVQVSQGL